MSREWRFYVADALRFCDRIAEYTGSLDQSRFEKDRRTYDATLRNIELIGEAVRQIPDDVTSRFPQIPWRQIVSTRNYLTHVYFGVDNDIIWDIVQHKIPELCSVLRQIAAEMEHGEN